MVRRTKDDGAVAVAEAVNPDVIAARVAAADAEARKAEAAADVLRWREIVGSIADGHEPDGKTIAAIGTLAQRLHLPPDAVARSVKAVQEERRQQAAVDATKQRLADVKAREQELAAEIKATEARLRELNTEVGTYHALARGYPFQAQAVAAVRSENPLLFGDVEHLSERITKADAAMSTEVFKPAKNYPHLEGASRGGWET